MKIIVLGAGQVGSTVADNLARENNDVTVVDTKLSVLQDLQNRLDLRTLVGQAPHPEVLRQAGADDADMLVAVTDCDEVNMAACQVAYTLFRTPTKIARLRAKEYMRETALFGNDHIPIDFVISPEMLVTRHIQSLIEFPGALQVLDFANGKLRLIGVTALPGSPIVGHKLKALREHYPDIDTRVAALYRNEQAIIPTGETVIEAGDDVFFLAASKDAITVMSELRSLDKPTKRVIIAGGGNIGRALAQALERKMDVRVIERSPERAEYLAAELNHALVLQGDAADHEMLIEESIEQTDFFCAVTNDDEANILSSMLAKRVGAKKALTLINRPAYVDLIPETMIDIAVSPHQITIGTLLTHIRRGDVVAVHSLRKGAAEVIEAIAHGDKKTSRVVGRTIEELDLPPDTTIGAVVRGEDVLMAHHDLLIEAEDHIILFMTDKKRIPQVERLFQVGVTFF